jgi:inactivated superfamily I helicase
MNDAPSGFTSVDAFLRAAHEAKASQLMGMEDRLAPIIDDPYAFSVPPELLSSIENLTESYGDEALKAIAMFCLSSWHGVHTDMLQQYVAHENNESALWTMGDSAKLSMIMQNLMELGSFSGDEQWKEMLKKTTAETVLQHFEEQNIPVDDFFGGDHA